MSQYKTEILPVTDAAIVQAAALIVQGEPVAVPTETVYGLAADATNPAAVAAIYTAKGRPGFNPLIVHVHDLTAATALAVFDDMARALAESFWPGPLTLVLPCAQTCPVATLATAGLPTIALRVSAHPAMQALLAASDRPLAAPSANASGRISPTRAAHVAESLGGRVPLILDGGPCAVGLESTIVAVGEGRVRLLRPGVVTPAEIGAVAGVAVVCASSGDIEAPGQMLSHYAPAKPLRLNVHASAPDEFMIGFGTVDGDINLSPAADLNQAAARLFDTLHAADAAPRAHIAIAPIPETGLGLAINDRLRRAAAPR
ncbi:MAG: threonylcarbamoyl-AMP synthase [Alphaproteobacteria bacterium]|nr:threonylcarbamoyl-AMP synthase [Alphaproteobacteria bacterium]MDE2041593.1 threonylcarbamoyl-AMP synthase [Alphaproteobacteria bacterium]MDE2340221.1 threonylcarbamoyl-AMP synthase [Alphaproteobacteria bacterium]